MDSQDLHNLHEAYLNVYEATGRDEMLAANIARARAPKPTASPSTPLRPATTSSLPTKPTGPVAQTPKPSGGGIIGKVDSTLRDVAGRVGGEIGAQQGRQKYGNFLGIPEKIGRNRGTQQGQQMYDKAKSTLGSLLKQNYEYDTFDIVLEHLIEEGYAETNENALVIMANMSEEWRESILEAEVILERRREDKGKPREKFYTTITSKRVEKDPEGSWKVKTTKTKKISAAAQVGKFKSGAIGSGPGIQGGGHGGRGMGYAPAPHSTGGINRGKKKSEQTKAPEPKLNPYQRKRAVELSKHYRTGGAATNQGMVGDRAAEKIRERARKSFGAWSKSQDSK